MSVPTIAIVGAGFSGTIVAVNLLRMARSRALRILLLERAQVGQGIAYASREYPYLLNVPAKRMSAFSTDPVDFLSFARYELPQVTEHDFLARELYGKYLKWILARARAAAPAHVRLTYAGGSAIAIRRVSSAFLISLADGRTLAADTVVLALGNPPPGEIPAASNVLGSSRYVEDPWSGDPTFHPHETILVLGTGPTMADIVLAGNASAHGRAVIHAISRHGLLATAQTEFRLGEDDSEGAFRLQQARSIRHLFRITRELADDVASRGGDWRESIALVRGLAPTLWSRLPDCERRRFLRHVRSYWDVHRHRLPPSVWTAVDRLRKEGTLQVHAGRINAMQIAGKRIRVKWRARGSARDGVLLADRVINCTGPSYDLRTSRERLLQSLVAQGMVAPDPLGLGLLTDEFGTLRGADGEPVANLYYIGPMLRADHWETTAVQELRIHAERLAAHLASTSSEMHRAGTGRSAAEGRPSLAASRFTS